MCIQADRSLVSPPPSSAALDGESVRTLAIVSHSHRGMAVYCSVAGVVEIRDTLALITDQWNRVDESLATLIREQGPSGARKAQRKTGQVCIT
jgi:hypothetical protein